MSALTYDSPPIITASALPETLRLSINSGGSGHGMSYWTEAAACGIKALLNDERRQEWRADPTRIPVFDQSKKSAFAVGSVYHKLHELWRLDRLAGTWFDFDEPLQDASVAQGLHLFREWHSTWPKHFWGRQLAVELNLPISEAARERVCALFGEVVNAQPDLVVEIREEDLERVRTRCPAIERPGNYIVDFKTAGARYDDLYYTGGTQALWYPLAWEIEYPDVPLEGIIFDVIIKPRANAKDQSIGLDKYAAVFASSAFGAAETLTGLVAQGRANLDRAINGGLGNRSECVKFGFQGADVCPFFGRQCRGGTL